MRLSIILFLSCLCSFCSTPLEREAWPEFKKEFSEMVYITGRASDSGPIYATGHIMTKGDSLYIFIDEVLNEKHLIRSVKYSSRKDEIIYRYSGGKISVNERANGELTIMWDLLSESFMIW